jgi:hypothetical protein
MEIPQQNEIETLSPLPLTEYGAASGSTENPGRTKPGSDSVAVEVEGSELAKDDVEDDPCDEDSPDFIEQTNDIHNRLILHAANWSEECGPVAPGQTGN